MSPVRPAAVRRLLLSRRRVVAVPPRGTAPRPPSTSYASAASRRSPSPSSAAAAAAAAAAACSSCPRHWRRAPRRSFSTSAAAAAAADRGAAVPPRSSVDPGEVGKFDASASEWWGEEGDQAAVAASSSSSSASSSVGPLRAMNPVRAQFIKRWSDAHYGVRSSLAGARVLDVGCGGGLLSETLAQFGAHVTGIDASPQSIAAAREHYASSQAGEAGAGSVTYRDDVHTVEDLVARAGPGQFDVVCALEVIEHVPREEQHRFVADCRALVKPDGCLFVSTMNRTARSLALAVFGAEVVLRMVPPGTHDWGKFVTPDELRKYVESDPWSVEAARAPALQADGAPEHRPWALKTVSGMQFNPVTNAWVENELDSEVNYIAFAARA